MNSKKTNLGCSCALSVASLSPCSTDSHRRASHSSIQFFQEYTSEAPKLDDEYITKRQTINKPQALKSIPVLNLTQDVTIIDGWVLSQLFLSGYAKMAQKIDKLNCVNVFSFADGGTGANMKVCLKLPVRNLFMEPSDSCARVASNLAADVLLKWPGKFWDHS